MKHVLLLALFPLTGCSCGPFVYEKTTSSKGVIHEKLSFSGASFLTKSKDRISEIDPKTGKISYRNIGNNETSVPSQFLTSDFLRNTIVPIAKP